MQATAPGKLILTGEYAVLDGAPALVTAVDRRVVARHRHGPRGSSPFLLAVADELAARYGAEHPSTQRALDIVVDSSPCYQGALKLGLGSSAAVTVAATALALERIDRDEVLAVASAAHAAAQAQRGGSGSGADVAAAVYGGVIEFRAGTTVPRGWPTGIRLIPFFTGQAAETPELIARVAEARRARPAEVGAALSAIAHASAAACAATAARPEVAGTSLIAAIALAAHAMDQLASATGVPLVPPCVTAARAAFARLGGTAKTTGAGGGDVAIGVIPATEDATVAERLLIETGCRALALTVDHTGVDLHPDAQ